MPLIMHGNWTVAVKEKNAAFAQRFIVSGAASGNGAYNVPHAPVYVTGNTWSVNIQSKPGTSPWADSEYQITFPITSAGQYQFDLQSNDVWVGDADFNDLILTFSTPVTETDFLIYGNVSTYNCPYNPCSRAHIMVESAAGLAAARRFPIMREAIDRIYPKAAPTIRIPLPDPPPDIPAGLLTQQTFKPIIIPLQDKTLIPLKKAQVMKRVAVENKPLNKKASANITSANLVSVRTVEVGRAVHEISVLDKTALGKLLDAATRLCATEELVNAALRFQEYDRTLDELNGGVYTGEGSREELGQVSTDRNGNYIFRFSRSLTQIIDETDVDVTLGENEVLYAMPDLIVQVLGASMPGGIPYETSPQWNVPVCKRINICIPSSYWHTPTNECHGKPISHIGFIPVGKTSAVTLDADGRVTCTDTSKADIPQTNCAAWYSWLRMSACIGKYDQVPHYTIEYRARRTDNTWTDWDIYQVPLSLDNWKTTTNEWVSKSVGPFSVELEIDKGQSKKYVQAYENKQGNMDWAGTDWFLKAIIPSWAYSFQGGPGSVEFRLKAYDRDGKQIQLWNDPVTGAPRYQDTVKLYIDHTGPELDFKDITIGTPTTNLCPLFTLTGTELVDATLNLKFKAVQRQGFLNGYTFSLTKCNTPNFAVEDVETDPAVDPHPLKVQYAAGPSACVGLYGTVFGLDEDADANDYVAVRLNPPGSTPWLGPDETLSSFTLNLSAWVRRTDGHSAYYPVGYGPIQYNIVIQKGS
jgi:hypothetical protein